MNNLFFDTETSGLPKNYKAHYSDIENWPRIVQLAWLIADEKGIPINQVLQSFLNDLGKSDRLVCHNVDFDLRVLQSELYRCKLNHKITLPSFCTMKNTTNYCQIPGPRGYKWPRLEELYRICFGKKIKQAHDAKVDVRATYEVFYKLKNENVFEL